jgi:CDP-diacylglycerol--serine O-phosphatidyltransferase
MPIQFFSFSNLLTYISLMAGLSAVLWSLKGSWHLAAINIGLSVLADLFDGKFAALFKRTTMQKEFGSQLDSLADGIVFGMVPVLTLIFLNPGVHGGVYYISLIAGVFYLLCAVTRLGYFNIHTSGSKVFTGLPTTIAALGWVVIYFFKPNLVMGSISFVLLGGLMVSGLQIPRPGNKGIIILFIFILALIGGHQYLLLKNY